MNKPLLAAVAVLAPALALVLALSCASQPGTRTAQREEPALPAASAAPEAASLGLEDLQGDFDYLASSALALNPLINADKPRLQALIEGQRARLAPGMGLLDFYRTISPVVSAMGCGHSAILMPPATRDALLAEGRFLPLEARVIGGRIFVWGGEALGPDRMSPARGSEIVSINGRGSRDIVARIAENLSADGLNLTKKYRDMSLRFSELYYLFLGSESVFSLEYLSPEGAVETVELPSISLEELEVLEGEDRIGPGLAPPPPLQVFFPAEDFGLLRIGSFAYYDPDSAASFKAFVDAFFAQLSERGIGKLVLDLRGNGGGDPWASSYLFTYLIGSPAPYFAEGTYGYYGLIQALEPAKNAFRGRLVTLIDGSCFSSTGHFCALLKYHGIGSLVGEESGGGFSCTDASTQIRLHNSGLVLSCSTREYAVAVSGMERGRGVMPDFEAVTGIQELLAGRDIPMERALSLLAAQR
jgi:hypothetical protein